MAITAAIHRAWSDAGGAIMVDLSRAETIGEMPVEILPEDKWGRVVVYYAPIVDGAVIAATEASGGTNLGTAHRAVDEFRTDLGRRNGLKMLTSAKGRCAATIAKTFAAQIEVASTAEGTWVDAKSVTKIIAESATKGAASHFRARAADANAALAALRDLVALEFHENENGRGQSHG